MTDEPRPCGLGNWGPEWADIGYCWYCGADPGPVKLEPFGGKPACQPCWEQICYGE